MSWSVSTNGKPAEVKTELDRQLAPYLAAAPSGLTDEGERETVRLISETISQCLGTFDANRVVTVSANGHMGFANWDTKEGAYQLVSISIQPGS